MQKKVQITAHSGADNTPENSLEFVSYALETEADALEVDVRRGADGILYLGHNAVEANAPALRQVFEMAAARPAIRVNCDLKEAGMESAVYALAAECGLAGRIIFSGTVDAAVVERDRALRQGAEIYLNIEEYVPDIYRRYRETPDFDAQAAQEIAAVCMRHGLRTVNVCERLVTRRFLTVLAAAGIDASVWTVDEPCRLTWFLTQGVRNITTCNVLKALELRGNPGE